MRRPPRIEPGPGQESVWDYPRPPRVERTDRHLRVEHRGVVVADTRSAWRVLETSQPPAYYLPPADVAMELLVPAELRTFCEWKGVASYLDLVIRSDSDPAGRNDADPADPLASAGAQATRVEAAAWRYPDPNPAFVAIRDHVAFYPQKVDACFVDGERVEPNDGGFYGGWISSWVVGPFKGGPGTMGW